MLRKCLFALGRLAALAVSVVSTASAEPPTSSALTEGEVHPERAPDLAPKCLHDSPSTAGRSRPQQLAAG